MSEKLDITAKQIGDALIDMSDVLKAKMEKWSDVPMRPNSLKDTECVGFINKETDEPGLNLVVDIQAPANTNEATLRIWGINSEVDADKNERFNNIQLDFDMEYTAARAIAQKGKTVTRDDIRAALRQSSTQLSHVVVGNQSGFDKATQQPLGERYDLMGDDELNQDESATGAAGNALNVVLPILKNSATV